MSDRAVSVAILADVKGFVAGVQRANAESRKMAGDLAKHAKDNAAAYEDLGRKLTGVGIAAGVGVALAVKSFATFDKQMSAVQAATLATSNEMDDLRDAAMQAGRDTAYSAQEAAGGVEQLAKAGVSTADILDGGLNSALALAAAGELDVARAAEIAASTMVQFNIAGEDVSVVADALAAGANKAQGSVEDLGLALEYAGVPAAALDMTVQETTGVLALFANAGITGEKAGTALRAMLVSLQNPSEKAATLMTDLGVEVFDAQGKFIGMEGVAGVLQDRMASLTDEQRGSALATIFGNESLGAATTLYNGGAEAVATWTENVSEAGYAAEVAATRLDNLAGDLQILKGSLETALIGLGESGSGPLRELTQDLTTLVNMFAELPEEAQSAITTLTLVTSGIGLAGGAAFLAAPKFLAANAALATMGPAGAKAAAGVGKAATALAGPWGLAVAGAVIAGGFLVNSYVDQKQAAEDYAGTLDELTGSITDNTREMVVQKLSQDGALQAASDLGIKTSDLVDAILGEEDALRRVNGAIREADETSQGYGRAVDGDTVAINNFRGSLSTVKDALGSQAEAIGAAAEAHALEAEARGLSAGAANKAATEYYEARDAIEATGAAAGRSTGASEQLAESLSLAEEEARTFEEQISDLEAALDRLFDEALSQQEAADNTAQGFQDMADKLQETKDAAEAADESWKPLTESIYAQTQAGRDHRDQLDTMIRTIGEEAVALAENGAAISDVTAKTDASREALILQAMEWGYTREEAEEYTASLAEVPDTVATTIELPGMAQAKEDAAVLKANLDNIPRTVRVDVTTYATTIRQDIAAANRGGTQPRKEPFNRSTRNADGGFYDAYADGGIRRESQIVRGGAYGRGIMWAEPETGWEAYISGKPGKRDRNLGVLAEAADRLGVSIAPAADGALFGRPAEYRPVVNVQGGSGSGASFTVAPGAIQVATADPVRAASEVLYGLRESAFASRLG